MTKYIIVLFSIVLFNGCMTMIQPKVECTKTWEGHYMNTNDFYKAVSNINLDKDQSIWVLSNTTLKRVLKNVQK